MPRTKSEEARLKMEQAALELSMELGVDKVTVAAIVERSGVAKTTFYRHFDSVSELVICSIDTHLEPGRIPDNGSLRLDFLELAEMLLPRFNDGASRQMITSLLHASAIDEELRDLHNRIDANQTQPVEEILKKAVTRGELPEITNIELAAEFVEGPFLKRILIKQQDLDHQEVVQLVNWICNGLNATSEPLPLPQPT